LLPKRISRSDEHSAFTDSERHLILAAETLRAGDTAARGSKPVEKNNDEKMSLFWRVFGGTILSICALSVITAYQSLANGIHEVRTDLGRVREAGGEYIKKDEFNTRSTTMWNRIQELQAINASVTVLTSKLTAVEQQASAAERERREMQATLAQVTNLKDRLALLDELRRTSEQDHKDLVAVGPALTTLKERDAILEKQLKDAESERKEVSRELQLLRERLAKLEGRDEGKPTAKPSATHKGATTPAKGDDPDQRD
jgi:DNA repair exonuclease SbcCD ATPase subunit